MDVIPKHDRATSTEVVVTKKPKRKVTVANSCAASMSDKISLGRLSLESNLLSASTKGPATEPISEKKKLRLKKKLESVAAQNEKLSTAINEKNNEIVDLKRSVKTLNEVLNSVPIDELRCNSSIASSKILELSKKNRQLRAELETTKNRCQKKDLQIQKLEHDLKLSDNKHSNPGELMKKPSDTSIDDLNGKINSLQQKLFESRNKNTELQSQLKLAQKCLQQEVGENFNLNILAAQATQSNWRGRAQQIIHLHQNINELKERLSRYEALNSNTGRTNMPPSGSQSLIPHHLTDLPPLTPANDIIGDNLLTHGRRSTSSASFDRFSPGVRKTEIIHRAKVEALENEITLLKNQLEDHKSKILALKVRNKTLNDDMVKYKVKSVSLEEQTDFNGMNLASMNEKLNMQKYQFENRMEELRTEMSRIVQQRKDAEQREHELREKMETIENDKNAKDDEICGLRNTIRNLEADLKAVCGDFLFACRELRKEEFIAILDALELEKNQTLEYNKNLKARLEQERTKNESLAETLAKLKVRASRMEAKLREQEKELELQTERKKRTQRINEYANSLSMGSLNGSVPSFVFENVSVNGQSIAGNEEITAAQVDNLRNQLELAQEKINLLEEKITNIYYEKEADAKLFNDTIFNSKNIILETIVNRKNSDTTMICDFTELS